MIHRYGDALEQAILQAGYGHTVRIYRRPSSEAPAHRYDFRTQVAGELIDYNAWEPVGDVTPADLVELEDAARHRDAVLGRMAR